MGEVMLVVEAVVVVVAASSLAYFTDDFGHCSLSLDKSESWPESMECEILFRCIAVDKRRVELAAASSLRMVDMEFARLCKNKDE